MTKKKWKLFKIEENLDESQQSQFSDILVQLKTLQTYSKPLRESNKNAAFLLIKNIFCLFSNKVTVFNINLKRITAITAI